jgi:phage/plasmid primase-like uncharacterized protein
MLSQNEKNDTINEAENKKKFDKKKKLYDFQSECLSHMAANGIPIPGPIIADGKIHRFSIDQKKNKTDEWYVAFGGVSSKLNPYLNCKYGSWSTGEKYFFQSWNEKTFQDEEELQELRRTAQDAKNKAKEAIREEHEKAALDHLCLILN